MTDYPRRAELPASQGIHAIHYRTGHLIAACGREVGAVRMPYVTNHGDDAPVTCSDCLASLEDPR